MQLRELVERLLGARREERKKRRKRLVVIDLRDRDSIRLPDGTIISRDRILAVDTERKVVIYVDDKGELREVSWEQHQSQNQ